VSLAVPPEQKGESRWWIGAHLGRRFRPVPAEPQMTQELIRHVDDTELRIEDRPATDAGGQPHAE
jgi:hypothetical protein